MWSIYTMEYYACIRKEEYLTFVATWTGLEEIMLSKISQAERVNYSVFLLLKHFHEMIFSFHYDFQFILCIPTSSEYMSLLFTYSINSTQYNTSHDKEPN